MSETTIIEDAGTGYRFSWGLALAGGIIAIAVTFLLLMLGSGVGLLLVHPAIDPAAAMPKFLSGGAIYFLVAQAFGFAVGGHVAGRLLGPMAETTLQEEIRAALHGLVSWALAVVGTLVLIAIAGSTVAALYGAAKPIRDAPAASATAYEVDRLFRPPTTQAGSAPTPSSAGTPDGADQADQTPAPDYTLARAAHGEATRILEAGFVQGRPLAGDDRDRLVTLISQGAGLPRQEAALRVDAATAEFRLRAEHLADFARRTASYASLWIGLSLLFGGLAAMVAAAMARLEDDHESPWTLFAFHRGWR
jgi:hypothetical protein